MAQTVGYFQQYNEANRPSKLHGIDVSRYQLNGVIDFTKAYAAGDRFVIFKAGGVTYKTFSARYIRCTVNGSNVNTSSIFNELKVYDTSGTEYAAGKTVTGSKPVPDAGSYSSFVDGNLNTYVLVGDNTQWVMVDLGSIVTNLYHVMIWHYAGRTFKDNKIEYSSDGVTWFTIFDSATSGEYLEQGGMDLYQYSDLIIDPQFTSVHVASARAAGLKIGTYFFKSPNYWNSALGRFINTTADASSHASSYYQFCTGVMGLSAGDVGDCFAWLDWENPNGNMFPAVSNSGSYDYIQTFCDTFKYMSSGRQCGVYTAFYTIDNLTAITALHLCYSVATTIGSVCPLWLAQYIDYSSSYPAYGYQAFGCFSSDLWTMWQYSSDNTSAANHGMLGVGLDLDISEGAIETLMQPTPISALIGVGGTDHIHLTWTTGETDVIGYMYEVHGFATATVSTGLEVVTIGGLVPNTTYTIDVNVFDKWEVSDTETIVVDTSAAMLGSYTLLSFQLP